VFWEYGQCRNGSAFDQYAHQMIPETECLRGQIVPMLCVRFTMCSSDREIPSRPMQFPVYAFFSFNLILQIDANG
jgi:hypothetical protein